MTEMHMILGTHQPEKLRKHAVPLGPLETNHNYTPIATLIWHLCSLSLQQSFKGDPNCSYISFRGPALSRGLRC